MVSVLTDLLVSLQEILFAAEGRPDGIWYYEDLGFKGKPFMSPAMYAELLLPGHVRTFDFAHAHGLPVIMHSCGYMYPLLPALVGAGLDCLQVIEVKAGMDLLQIHREFGQKLALMGGMDARVLISNDLAAVDRELEAKLPAVKEGFGYCLHSDHSIPADVAYETYRHFLDRGRALGTY
jgi:uroporphyrinogen decarboxylase